MTRTVWTVGHSTRPLEELIAMLQTATITTIADVRRFPGSRQFPQYRGYAAHMDTEAFENGTHPYTSAAKILDGRLSYAAD